MQDNTLTIWGRRNSFNVQKVMWLIAELDLPHLFIPTGGSYGGLDSPTFLAMNPHGRVPVINDNGHVVWESHAILRYLAAKFGQGNFWSDNIQVRSTYDQWMDWSQTALQPDFLTGIFWGYYRTPPAERNLAAIQTSLMHCNAHFHLLNHLLEKKQFIGGDSISLADITIGTTLYRYFELDIQRPSLHNVEAWYERLQTRKAYREHVMIPFDDMKGRLTF
ncbi:MAG TPA: glutathione S-transferase [Legionella sp.]|nr:glutathione S-transferase [Legionella sp.]